MFCPECRAEYREGFTECSDCHVPLAATLPAEAAPEPAESFWEPAPAALPPRPDAEFVTVFGSADPIVRAMARGALEDAGIPFLTTGAPAGRVRAEPIAGVWSEFLVSREDEAAARASLEPLTTPIDEEPR